MSVSKGRVPLFRVKESVVHTAFSASSPREPSPSPSWQPHEGSQPFADGGGKGMSGRGATGEGFDTLVLRTVSISFE